jgi:sorting nexin-8
VWLYDILLRRHPFRLLPPIPPKKLQADARFLRQRVRALRRWMELVQKHPVLGADHLVHSFLTVRTDFVQFRKSGDASWLDEEFGDHGLSPEQVVEIPEHFDAILSTVKLTLPALLESYRGMAILFEGMANRTLEEAMDHNRFSLLLDSVKTHVCYKPACPECLATSQVDSTMSLALKDHRQIRESLVGPVADGGIGVLFVRARVMKSTCFRSPYATHLRDRERERECE